jgi:hypothetical protein
MKIWLDDLCEIECNRKTPDSYVGVKTAKQAIKLLKTGKVTYISFDHDLGPSIAGTGYLVAQYIEKAAYLDKIPKLDYDVHSSNPVGRKNIESAMENANKFWNTNLIKKMNDARRPYLNQVCEINRKYNFSHDGRSKEDEELFDSLWNKMDEIDKKFDKSNPIPPCNRCGGEMKVSLLGLCASEDCKQWFIPGG